MEKIIAILKEIQPDLDTDSKRLIDDQYLDSLSILSLVAELEDAFDVMIPAVEITAQNFNSVEGIYQLVERLKEED
ncbi:MAG TPA: acyl carrier protein [Candidatus Fimiplasma intestinipullorum]|uniref:Acyl carrier protein n=1 Tax=Candidatus Fimiplasma intestinipullorum TaxID=2840825 RepID=A0A9D1KZI9_9FIRM|nr:acyl carrier protein [Candidatus Fimiplasma intestinipullorum]